ncbi:hypothetical protein QA584_18760 [Anaerocolumna sp. AGMB13025]|uniref:hypothetical protein n=1 Tax=Anaerocolumna sp. AGMB13025 TaxID=3039116 RepID=UPI00241FC0EA|nr:hypothetical protein [Anaerocolumna sp. AGMB13025]WFR55639.1 hypothetical protein QA584_18760 [Anaerocolumna sp. AGMB13025]
MFNTPSSNAERLRSKGIPVSKPKGYIFKQENNDKETLKEFYKIIIGGSSNMTGSALTVNKEWLVKRINVDNIINIYNVAEEKIEFDE